MSGLLSSVVMLPQRFNMGPLTVHRPSASPAINEYGGYDAPADATFNLDPVTVYPATPRQLEQLPEADRNSQTIALVATERLYAADGGKLADRVVYRSRTYRVVAVEDHELAGGVYLALAQLEEKTA